MLVEDDVEAAIRGLKARLVGGIAVSGPDLARSLTDLGLIDEDRTREESAVLAEREGFEPPIPLRVCRISSAVLSTTQPPLQWGPNRAMTPLDGALFSQAAPPKQGRCADQPALFARRDDPLAGKRHVEAAKFEPCEISHRDIVDADSAQGHRIAVRES